MKLRSALLAATVMVAPVAVKAQAVSGLYIGAGAGANFMQDESIDSVKFPQVRAGVGVQPITTTGNRLKLDTGFVGVASVGYGLGNGLRFELEGGYRDNKLSGTATSIRGLGGTARNLSAGGDEYKYTAFLNVLYDIDLNQYGISAPVIPYVGVGGGVVYAQEHNARLFGNTGPVNGFPTGINTLFRTNEGRASGAYQAIVGAAVPLPAVPGLSLTFEYRFMGIINNRSYNYQYFQSSPAPGLATAGRIKQSDDYNHSIMVGFRYAFNAAPAPLPPVPPMPPQAGPRTYLVFFDWDRADLTDRARQIIAEAAQATTRVQVTRIMVSGHTDTTGTARYNQGLSVRRAQNVAAELVRDGVPRAAISTAGFGFSRPLVATGPGVREPQNRRVEIVLQ